MLIKLIIVYLLHKIMFEKVKPNTVSLHESLPGDPEMEIF